jgi:hypothetical protein
MDMLTIPDWKRPPRPDPVLHEVEVPAILLDRLLPRLYECISADDPATKLYANYLKKVEVRLVEGGVLTLVTFPVVEALIFVADHVARVLDEAKRPEHAEWVRKDRDLLDSLRSEYTARLCPDCNGEGLATSKEPVFIKISEYKIVQYNAPIDCPKCEGTGLFPPSAHVYTTVATAS